MSKKKLPFLITLLCALAPSLWANVSEDYSLHLQFLQGFDSRTEGSEEEQKTFRYITTYAQRLDLPVTVHKLDQLEGSHSYSSLLEVVIPGQTKEELVYLFPVSQPPFSDKNTYSASLAMGMSLLEALQDNTHALTTRLVFLGGNIHTSSEEYLRILQQDRIDRAYLYLAFDTLQPEVTLHIAAQGSTTPLYLVEQTVQAFEQFSVPLTIHPTHTHIERLRLSNETPPLAAFLAMREPAMGLTLTPKAGATANPEAILKSLAMLANEEPNTARLDRNYLAIPWKDTIITIQESSYLAIVFSTFLLFIVLPFIRKRWFHRYVLTIKRHFFSLLLLIGIGMLVLWGSTALMYGLSYLRNMPNLYSLFPILMVVAKVSLSLLVWVLIRSLLPKWLKYKGSSFYSASALFIFVLLTLVATLMDVTLSVYFIPALLFMVVSIIMRAWWIKVLFFFLSLGYMTMNVLLMLFSEIPRAYFILTLSPRGAILEAMVILSYGLLLLRLIRPEMLKIQKKNFYIITITFLGICCVGSTAALMLANPFDADTHMQVIVTQQVRGESNITTLYADGPLQVTEDYVAYQKDANTIQFSTETLHKPLSWEKSSKTFLNRQEHHITILAEDDVSYITANLDISQAIPVIYDANFPYLFDFENQKIIFFIGSNPPNPLEISCTLSKDAVSTLEVKASYYHGSMQVSDIITNRYIDVESTYVDTIQIPIAAN